MRHLFIVLGLIAAVLALVLAVTPFLQIAYLPAIAALLFGGIAFYISKQSQTPKKSIQLIFLLTIISLILTTYKTIFSTTEVGNLEELELKEDTSEELDLDKIDPATDDTNLNTSEMYELPVISGMEDQ